MTTKIYILDPNETVGINESQTEQLHPIPIWPVAPEYAVFK
jgi:hypothetical protein